MFLFALGNEYTITSPFGSIGVISASFGFKETIMSNYLFYVWPSRWALPIGFLAMALALILSTTYLLNKKSTHSPQVTSPEDDLVE